jgi:hypothetical protein
MRVVFANRTTVAGNEPGTCRAMSRLGNGVNRSAQSWCVTVRRPSADTATATTCGSCALAIRSRTVRCDALRLVHVPSTSVPSRFMRKGCAAFTTAGGAVRGTCKPRFPSALVRRTASSSTVTVTSACHRHCVTSPKARPTSPNTGWWWHRCLAGHLLRTSPFITATATAWTIVRRTSNCGLARNRPASEYETRSRTP